MTDRFEIYNIFLNLINQSETSIHNQENDV